MALQVLPRAQVASFFTVMDVECPVTPVADASGGEIGSSNLRLHDDLLYSRAP